VSVCVADKIGQFRKELRLKRSCSRASVAGLEGSGHGPWQRKNVGGGGR